MQTLSEFNVARHKAWDDANNNRPRPNDIACPKCSAELMDTCPSVTLTSNPPQKNVHCPNCDFAGYRIA